MSGGVSVAGGHVETHPRDQKRRQSIYSYLFRPERESAFKAQVNLPAPSSDLGGPVAFLAHLQPQPVRGVGVS